MAKFSRYDSRNKKQDRNKKQSQNKDFRIKVVQKNKSKYNIDWSTYSEDKSDQVFFDVEELKTIE